MYVIKNKHDHVLVLCMCVILCPANLHCLFAVCVLGWNRSDMNLEMHIKHALTKHVSCDADVLAINTPSHMLFDFFEEYPICRDKSICLSLKFSYVRLKQFT